MFDEVLVMNSYLRAAETHRNWKCRILTTL